MKGAKTVAGNVRGPPSRRPDSGRGSPVKWLEKEFKKHHELQDVALKKGILLLAGIILLWLLIHISGIYLFLNGFLLTRLVLPDKSECASPPVTLSDDYVAGSVDTGCWHPKSFNKAIIIVVDALRYDFTVPFSVQNKSGSPQPYHDTLSLFYQLAVRDPKRAVLLPFIADPPTTTLQRIKGLTTGSLPTFVDAGSNFAGEAIEEDNIISQLRASGKNLVLLGDDTWNSLFPTSFDPELSRHYFSLTVEDLYTVDTGVTDHLFPLLSGTNTSKWDVLVGHYLGVDHAGHRYGPDHAAMTGKLREMNDVFTRLIEEIEDDTLLVVMGDHGMDGRGNHGGESDDEVEAALWMYSKREMFGRTDPNLGPPKTAKERAVRQVDLVPTLSLLLGVPIPYNNLGKPIDSAFVTRTDSDFANLAKVHRLTGAQIKRYQDTYKKARDIKDDDGELGQAVKSWRTAEKAWSDATNPHMKFPPLGAWSYAYRAFEKFELDNLQACRERWASFDMITILGGITVLALAFVTIGIFANISRADHADYTARLLRRGAIGYSVGAAVGAALSGLEPNATLAFCSSLGGIAGMMTALLRVKRRFSSLLPRSCWSWSCAVVTLLLGVGFAANSFTIWEDENLLFLLCTSGIMFLVASMRQKDEKMRRLGVWQSISFIVCTRLASVSRACREEQKSACSTTYYASASSTTSAWWQLMIPFFVCFFLPGAVSAVFARSKNCSGSAKLWLGVALPAGLSVSTIYWMLEAAEASVWFPSVPSTTLKTLRSVAAQVVLAIAFAAGYSTFVHAGAFVSVEERRAPAVESPDVSPRVESLSRDPSDPTSDIFTSLTPQAPASEPRPQLAVYGYANTHGTRYAILLAIWVLALILVQKPMGQGALALCLISIFNLLEIIDVCELRSTPVGPVVLALLGSFHFFKTGHQATLASIQWESAFVATRDLVYPWGPILVTLNTLGPQILCAIAVPATVLWKIEPAQKAHGLIGDVARASGTHILFHAGINVATVAEAAWLRRHLMLYRVFMPRMLLSVLVLVVVEAVVMVVGLSGVWWSASSVGETFERLSLSILGMEGRGTEEDKGEQAPVT